MIGLFMKPRKVRNIPKQIPYHRNGKDSLIGYIREFERLNNLKHCPILIGKKVYD